MKSKFSKKDANRDLKAPMELKDVLAVAERQIEFLKQQMQSNEVIDI
jgi:hypothetical protein